MSEADPPAARLAYETPAPGARRQGLAQRFVGIALARRLTGEERRNPLLGAGAGAAGVVILILWISWIGSGR